MPKLRVIGKQGRAVLQQPVTEDLIVSSRAVQPWQQHIRLLRYRSCLTLLTNNSKVPETTHVHSIGAASALHAPAPLASQQQQQLQQLRRHSVGSATARRAYTALTTQPCTCQSTTWHCAASATSTCSCVCICVACMHFLVCRMKRMRCWGQSVMLTC